MYGRVYDIHPIYGHATQHRGRPSIGFTQNGPERARSSTHEQAAFRFWHGPLLTYKGTNKYVGGRHFYKKENSLRTPSQ